MSQTIRIRRITQAGYVPIVTDLVAGELALNVPDGVLYGLTGAEGNYTVSQLNGGGDVSTVRVTNVNSVADEAAMLAIVGADEGDVAIWDNGNAYINNGGTAGTVADWSLMSMTAVASVNGQTGAVTLDASNIEPVADRNYVTDSQLAVLEDILANGYDGGTLGVIVPNPPTTRVGVTAAGVSNATYNTSFIRSPSGLQLNGNRLEVAADRAAYFSNDGTNNVGIIWNSVTSMWNFISTVNEITVNTDIVQTAVVVLGATSIVANDVRYPDSQGAVTLTYDS